MVCLAETMGIWKSVKVEKKRINRAVCLSLMITFFVFKLEWKFCVLNIQKTDREKRNQKERPTDGLIAKPKKKKKKKTRPDVRLHRWPRSCPHDRCWDHEANKTSFCPTTFSSPFLKGWGKTKQNISHINRWNFADWFSIYAFWQLKQHKRLWNMQKCLHVIIHENKQNSVCRNGN